MNIFRSGAVSASLVALTLLTSCDDFAKPRENLPATPTVQEVQGLVQSRVLANIDVYKNPSCTCCSKWINHVERAGFNVHIHSSRALEMEKDRLGIAPQYRSCHTAVTREGFVFEGHIPAQFMLRFLEQPPLDALGLVVPGMPLGSPGMEVRGHVPPYDILLLKRDGSSDIYANAGSIQAATREGTKP